MSVSITVAGVTLLWPEEGDTYRWGPDSTAIIQRLGLYTLQTTGGAFTLTADANFGANFGLVSAYFKSRTANIGTAGVLRLARADSIGWRNEANNGNLLLAVDASDVLTFNGVPLISASGGLITNANVSPSAAIALSKLAALTATKFLESDGSGVIVVSTGSGYAKASSGTPSYVAQIPLATDVSGILAKPNGGAGADMSSVTFPSSGTILTDPATTKGDLLVRNSSVVTRLPVGTNGQVLAADSAEATGVKWADPVASPQFSAEASNYSIALSSGSGALTIALKDAAGADPSGASTANFAFRSATATSGTFTKLSRDSALSLVLSSGSTLGMASGSTYTVWVGVVDDDGTEANMELIASLSRQSEQILQSCTAEGGAGAADSNRVIYATSAQSSRPIRWIASFTITPTTAGTWDTADISRVNLLPLAEEKILVRVNRSTSSQTISTSGTIIYNEKVKDSHNAFNTSTGVFTVPEDGDYEVSINAFFSNISGTNPGIQFFKNDGSPASQAEAFFAATLNISTVATGSASTIISALAGNTLFVNAFGDASFDIDSSNARNSLVIRKVG